MAAHDGEFLIPLPELSNSGCHPGKAGGSPPLTLDDDGFLFVTGRIKEAMVTASGETIYPDEVESYYAHPLFAELCVAPVAASDGNDIPVLFVVPTSPDLADRQLRDAFADLCAAAPARLRVSRIARLTRPLPRTLSGKIRRRLVAQASTYVGGS